MESILNRRMFQKPVYAAEGTYMPSLEQILNFYRGEVTPDGQPADLEAFQEAFENATKALEAGITEGAAPYNPGLFESFKNKRSGS